ncbi:MAG: 3-oxoadipyl-CoA thiolase [Deltaproteobacteria bacterium]|nr:3-oxoadipyl-CoA thiolase [Deltaproteobacteria bacterium]
MKNALIIDGVRTPIGSLGGSLSAVRADELGALVIQRLCERQSGLSKESIEDVLMGCANQAGEDNRNVARMSALLGGLPISVAGQTVNRLCASGLNSVASAAQAIAAGEGDVFIAGGLEQMTRAPFVLSKSETPFARNVEFFDTSLGWRFVNPRMREMYGVDSMGQTAENVAEKFSISRADQDEFALRSQLKAARAREAGRFKTEIVAVAVPKGKGETISFEHDEFLRPSTTLEGLAKLKPAFRTDGKGSVTAGNSAGLNDGACALLLASEGAAKSQGLKPRGRIIATAVAGVEPRIMGIGPVPATQKVLARAGLKLSDISVIELNEAFAAQSLACIRELGLKDDDSRINPNGGAIALGHPLGMSGSRLVLTALHELEIRNERYALCTMCVGVGQGMAAIVERVG